jgi:hypothetical protein
MRIKAKYLIFFLVFAMQLISCGQTSVGIKGGINWGSIRNSKDQAHYDGTYKVNPSYCFGMDLKVRLLKLLKLGGSFEYNMNDFQWYAAYGGHQYTEGKDVHYRTGYLRFTLFPEFTVGNKLHFYCNAGPYLSLMINSARDGEIWSHAYPGHYVDEPVTGSAKDDIKTFDAGLRGCIGAGFNVINHLNIFIESGGNLGLVNISKSGYGDAETWGISVSAGILYKFPKNKKAR